MNTTDFDELKSLLREKAQIEKLMSRMDEQKKSIRLYCLAALKDIKSNLSALTKILADNLYLFKTNRYKELTVGDEGMYEYFTFRLRNDVVEINNDVYYRDSYLHNQKAESCMGYFFCGVWDVDKRIAEITSAKQSIEGWTDTKRRIDLGKNWIAQAISITKKHIAQIVHEQKRKMESGIEAASEEYKKIMV